LLCHPHPAFGGDLHTPLVADLFRAAATAGLAVLRFNFRGVSPSTGRASGGRDEPADVLAAAAFLDSRGLGAERMVLCGYSFGAAMALAAIDRGLRTAACVAIGFPTAAVESLSVRESEVLAALARGVPTLLLAGERDTFCDPSRLAHWAEVAGGHVQVEVLAGRDHFFADPEARREVVARVLAFLDRRVSRRG
jgi:alpha/beta superfamily hydrolase